MQKKKVAVITRHAISNYGSLLQTIATQKTIEAIGCDCVVIDYVREDENYKNVEKTLLSKKKRWNKNWVTRAMYLILRQPESFFAGRRFAKWRAETIHTSVLYQKKDELCLNPPKADVYMTGSDQVWGPVSDGSFDDSYMLSFVGDESKKISYAASFGKTEMTDEMTALFKKYLSGYQHISVREESAVELISQMGLEAKQVLDPTLLCDSTFWDKYIQDMDLGKYVLVYQLHNDNRLGEYAEKVAAKKGLPLIRMSASFHQITRQGKFYWLPSVGQFLYLIKNAECMITDSFHGTAFAINFNTNFVEVLPNNNTGTRNVSILKLTNLSDRILQDFNDLDIPDRVIDFSYANSVIEEKKKESIDILRDMIFN